MNRFYLNYYLIVVDFYIEHFERFSNYYKLIKMYKDWALDSDIVLLNTLNNSEDDYFNKIQIIDNAGTWEVDSKKFKSCFRHELRNIEKYIIDNNIHVHCF